MLLSICVAYDSATSTDTISNMNEDTPLKDIPNDIPKNTIVINDTHAPIKNSGKAVSDGKVYTDKSVKPTKVKPTEVKQTITMTGKPSCSRCARNHCAYTWRTKTYENYCPNCHHRNCLGNKHKWGSRHEQEITCLKCDSDFCINCGKEKYSWSNVHLRKA